MTGRQPFVPPSPDRMALALSTIADQARRTNLARAAELRTALGQAAAGLDDSGWEAAERTAHQLAGSAGTFGFASVSERARLLERYFADGAALTLEPTRLAEASAVLSQLTEQLAGEPDLD